jgi:hypothetical protein
MFLAFLKGYKKLLTFLTQYSSLKLAKKTKPMHKCTGFAMKVLKFLMNVPLRVPPCGALRVCFECQEILPCTPKTSG